MQGVDQYGIHSAQSYVLYWAVVHFVSPGFMSGMSPPKPVELHFVLKQIKKGEGNKASIVRLRETEKDHDSWVVWFQNC